MYHINPERGPLKCKARKGNCPYGVDAPHFATLQQANDSYEKLMRNSNSVIKTHRKSLPVSYQQKILRQEFTDELKDLDEKLDDLSFSDIVEYVDSDINNFSMVDKLINARSTKVYGDSIKLEKLNPANKMNEAPITQKDFKLFKKDLNSYRDHSAVMVEALSVSINRESPVIPLEKDVKLGNAIISSRAEANSGQWLKERSGTIGGSDVGALVVNDFTPSSELKGFDKLKLKGVEKSKINPVVREWGERTDMNRNGALYRGTVWEDRLRDDFANDHPELKVYYSNNQYSSLRNPMQKVNLDGIISNRDDGKPNGILEIKTASDSHGWNDGVPLAYRGQVLYYLNTVDFDYAYVKVCINDGESREYILNKNDEVAPGCGYSMQDYIDNRVTPWFNDLMKQRDELELSNGNN